jgi:hypothetical protein
MVIHKSVPVFSHRVRHCRRGRVRKVLQRLTGDVVHRNRTDRDHPGDSADLYVPFNFVTSAAFAPNGGRIWLGIYVLPWQRR